MSELGLAYSSPVLLYRLQQLTHFLTGIAKLARTLGVYDVKKVQRNNYRPKASDYRAV